MFPHHFPTRASIALFALCSSAWAQAWTEQAVVALFDQQSPMRRESQAATAATIEAVRGRTLWPNPTAVFSRETAGFTEFAFAEQQLPISGRLKLERQALDPARAAMEAQGAARLWDARCSLRAAFYRALAAQRQAEVTRGALTRIGAIIETLGVREREGEGSRYDRVRVEREAADMRADLALAEARARSERGVMLAYLPQVTIAATLLGDVAPRDLPAAKEEIIRQALDRRAELRAETSRVAQLNLEQQAADRRRIPEPVVTAGFKRTQVFTNQIDSGAVFGVAMPLPIFDRGQADIARLTAEQAQAQARRDVVAQQIAASVASTYDVYVARREVLGVFERETTGAGEELLRITRAGYEEGELGILQLLDAYRIERQTALRRVDLQFAVKEIEIELARAAGYEVTQ